MHRVGRISAWQSLSQRFPAVVNCGMCRWMAYSGEPILAEDLLFRPEHSLIDQSLHAHLGESATNGDGFGIGWYGEGSEPAVYKSIEPAWNDSNLREIAGQVRTPMLLAHVRYSTGTAVQRSNCHPFRHGKWLWVHNGLLRGFHEIRRDLVLAVDPALFPDMEGSTDTEALFYLALTFGLGDDPFGAVARAVGYVEDVGPRSPSFARCTPKSRCCANSATVPASWCPSRCAISKARGTRYRNPRLRSWAAVPTRSGLSRRSRPEAVPGWSASA